MQFCVWGLVGLISNLQTTFAAIASCSDEQELPAVFFYLSLDHLFDLRAHVTVHYLLIFLSSFYSTIRCRWPSKSKAQYSWCPGLPESSLIGRSFTGGGSSAAKTGTDAVRTTILVSIRTVFLLRCAFYGGIQGYRACAFIGFRLISHDFQFYILACGKCFCQRYGLYIFAGFQ